ncbi:hypothetical protein SOCEGT47_082070 [Sorangium cellulosum]|jgi:hypothetical protein|uniref:Uncharacterized protein n=2 Tax=Sorangium cellulosum TaxID=56 RepID=A0A4P2QDV4_SORCE|nr:hypothetical protein SOCEGT47_082070 [Sorangium cellulosum]
MVLVSNSSKIAVAGLRSTRLSVRSETSGPGARADVGRARSFLALRARMLSSPSLAGALQFMQVTTRPWEPHELTAWLHEHVVAPGWMKAPRAVREPGADVVALCGIEDRRREVAALAERARRRVALALLDFVAPNPEGGFLRAALYSARVRWSVAVDRAGWLPAPRESDFLSDVVLSLFAAEILSGAELYRSHMTVCAACGRVAFAQEARPRGAGCPRCDGEIKGQAL